MAKVKHVLLRLRERDTSFGVTKDTLGRLAQTFGMNETDVIHKALADSARLNLPQYEPDDGALTEADHRRIRKEVRRRHGGFKVTSHLFEKIEREPGRGAEKAVRAAPRPR